MRPLFSASRKGFAAAVLAGLLMVGPGCSLFQKQARRPDPTVIPAAHLNRQIRDDRARLAGEDGSGSRSHFVYGVDVGYDSWYYAPFHVAGGLTLRVVEFFDGEKPLKYAVQMEDTRSSDSRRQGILKVAAYPFARRGPYVKRYAQIAQEGGIEPGIKAASIRALNRSRDKTAIDLYIRLLENTEPTVRLESAKALANIPSEQAIPALIKHLNSDDNKDVRIACADALREYKTLDVSRALINVLGDRDFAVAWQARQSLNLMTGHDYRYDDIAWLDYFSKAKSPFI